MAAGWQPGAPATGTRHPPCLTGQHHICGSRVWDVALRRAMPIHRPHWLSSGQVRPSLARWRRSRVDRGCASARVCPPQISRAGDPCRSSGQEAQEASVSATPATTAILARFVSPSTSERPAPARAGRALGEGPRHQTTRRSAFALPALTSDGEDVAMSDASSGTPRAR